jgi:hypothetical protein
MDASLLRSVGDEAIGTISVYRYSREFDSLANKRFVAAMWREYGVLSGSYSVQTYIVGQCIEAAIEKLSGEADDTCRGSTRGVAHRYPRGPARLIISAMSRVTFSCANASARTVNSPIRSSSAT